MTTVASQGVVLAHSNSIERLGGISSLAAHQTEDEHTLNYPCIRLVPHVDSTSRHALQFEPIERRIPGGAIIKIGRFTDRQTAAQKTAITFKSKVVSRNHAEMKCDDGRWYIRDIGSSSGTFLNHIRLAGPNAESKPFPMKDGDIIQLGIDFRGGTEEIYRCVKMRVEVNRAWQHSLNRFNVATHLKLRSFVKHKNKTDNDSGSTYVSECCICLFNIAPCQALFVSPCSHIFHFKCIKPLVFSTDVEFLCPLCRAGYDLETSIANDLSEDWEDLAQQADHTPMAERFSKEMINGSGRGHCTGEDKDGISRHADSSAIAISSSSNSVSITTAAPDIALSMTPHNDAGPLLLCESLMDQHALANSS
ncbi:E3 ubiquitin-protein ligase DMA2 [Neolecta irregularis DAH-3]|uniref:E3 ubiquitin-protein ligase DMA2 n=1 Tax=Neolecta irregularis (strain DAH-3) TaxID=1198029 RepID=A0A1U7LTJ6_NEOID|nr:E3 ubiquitin-protein ligase DMA2 [Neolecta irregularis DAH-3]|eukprot:OLL25987.1 E3 ubiquitin-protein ligase DMA2 [Neolecta irregularis DAH-3]